MPRSTPSLFAGFSYLHDKGERVGKEARHNKGVYLTLCLRRNESSKFTIIKVLNLATVDAPGVIFFIPVWLYVSHHCILTDAVYFGIHILHG